jgi:hypothetical protein
VVQVVKVVTVKIQALIKIQVGNHSHMELELVETHNQTLVLVVEEEEHVLIMMLVQHQEVLTVMDV